MKNIFVILIAAVVLTSCKSNSFLRQRYTHFSHSNQKMGGNKPAHNRKTVQQVNIVNENIREVIMAQAVVMDPVETKEIAMTVKSKAGEKTGGRQFMKQNTEKQAQHKAIRADIKPAKYNTAGNEIRILQKPVKGKYPKEKDNSRNGGDILMMLMGIVFMFGLFGWLFTGFGEGLDLGGILFVLLVIGFLVLMICIA